MQLEYYYNKNNDKHTKDVKKNVMWSAQWVESETERDDDEKKQQSPNYLFTFLCFYERNFSQLRCMIRITIIINLSLSLLVAGLHQVGSVNHNFCCERYSQHVTQTHTPSQKTRRAVQLTIKFYDYGALTLNALNAFMHSCLCNKLRSSIFKLTAIIINYSQLCKKQLKKYKSF